MIKNVFQKNLHRKYISKLTCIIKFDKEFITKFIGEI